MELSYWQSRWRKGKTGFHMDRVYPGLIQNWDSIPSGHQSTVLVPLCGKSLDIMWLAKRCRKVIGVEISKIAVQNFFEESHLIPEIEKQGAFTLYRAGNITIWCGNFFHLPRKAAQGVTLIYDKAAIVALPPDKRRGYSKKLHELTDDSIPILIHHFSYNQNEMNGPPFSVPPEEIAGLFGPGYRTTRLEENHLNLDDYKKFKNRGLRGFFIEFLSLLLPEEQNC